MFKKIENSEKLKKKSIGPKNSKSSATFSEFQVV